MSESLPNNPDFELWWDREGIALVPSDGEDFEEHAKRIAEIAWDNAKYKIKEEIERRARK